MKTRANPKNKLSKFVCSYAYDVSAYVDFTVEAVSEQAAKRQIQKALRADRFINVSTTLNYDCISRHRVFVDGPATEHATSTTMEELVAEADKSIL
ncbi:MAG TPA: hypothetical protein VGR14_03730 [Verrucomicrobiae bacterium]|jgi:hypothetical protein|nr:hypothetical protein [Verrucomicrobiae bacterium]